MPAHQTSLDSVALIAELVRRASNRPGRTAIMKFAYFLKTLREVPLRYRFGLYTYGPFDSDVLDDLRYAESLDAVESNFTQYPGGSVYEYNKGPKIDEVTNFAEAFIAQHGESIDWVLENFGNRSARDLEMASTLVYVDRATAGKGATQSIDELATKVRAIKPYLSIGAIEREAHDLKEKGLLTAVN
jgi:hypothetical protein